MTFALIWPEVMASEPGRRCFLIFFHFQRQQPTPVVSSLVGGFCEQLASVSPRRTPEDQITPASLHVIVCFFFLQLAGKLASASSCLLAVCVMHGVDGERERQREQDWLIPKTHCLKQRRSGHVSNFNCSFFSWFTDVYISHCQHVHTS